MSVRVRLFSLVVFGVLAAVSGAGLERLRYSFDFEQFFPKGDPDLEFFRRFVEDFEPDDNFLLIALERPAGVFDSAFLARVHDLTLRCRQVPHVLASQSLTTIAYPLKTPFGLTSIPVVHLDEPARYPADRRRILQDERLVMNFISEDATALTVYLKVKNSIQLAEARELMNGLDALLAQYPFEEVYLLGRPYFQVEMVDMQRREVLVTTLLAGLLVTLVMVFLYRRFWSIALTLVSLGLGMLLFMGFLAWAGRELNAISALYPLLMIIVGTSDVIHILSKYQDELGKGLPPPAAIRLTIRQIGLATFMTSLTTAVGFASLVTSRTEPIRDFGLNAAVGVLIAYGTILFFTAPQLSAFHREQLAPPGRGDAFWQRLMEGLYRLTRTHPRRVLSGFGLGVGLCFLGISQISTNYTIIRNMPRGQKITRDFRFFEEKFTGFRPLEIAVFAQGGRRADELPVLREMDKVEGCLKQFPEVRAVTSVTMLYKSLHQAFHGNRPEAYRLPETEGQWRRYHRLLERIEPLTPQVLLSRDGTKARISSRILDTGADSIAALGARLDRFVREHTDSTVARFRRTGTGLIIDKNAAYIRDSLLKSLALAVGVVCTLMGLLFGRLRMLIVALAANLMPLLVAGALLGFLGIELEAGVSVVFAIIFGIAVDDSIHFLSKYKLARRSGLDPDAALHTTFRETGKAICLTTLLLFFGFLIMLFSIHPPSVTIGWLISVTLLSALLSDLLLLPVLLRLTDE